MIQLKRKPLWRADFKRVIDDMRRRPFDWETQYDCGLGLVVETVRVLTGHDFGAPYRGRYKTPAGAYRMMRKEGFENLADLVASLGPEIRPSQCMTGDVVAFRDDGIFGHALGIVNGERSFVMKEDGLGTMDTLAAERAFRVG